MNATCQTSTLFSLIYVSSAVETFSNEELVSLLQTRRGNNTADRVTGMLLYKEGNFMQVLEGEEEKVRRLHDRIQRDPRHRGLITLLEQRTAERQFSGWSMGFRNLSDPGVRETPGYSEFLNVSLNDERFFRVHHGCKNC